MDKIEPTKNGDDDNDEVEYVPWLSEVVPAIADELHKAFGGEDCNEDRVDDGQGVGKFSRLTVMLHSHRHHIEHDDGHYHDVELLVGDD